MKPSISLIVNSFGRSKISLQQTLAVAFKTRPLEVIVIDQNSPTLGLETEGMMHVFWYPEKSISKARNFAATKAKGDFLVFLDDDALLSSSALDELIHYLEHFPSHLIVGGTIMVQENPLEHYSVRQKLPSGKLDFLHLKAVMGGLFAVQKNLYLQLKGMDENFGIGSLYPSSEDTDFVWTAHAQGNVIGFCQKFLAFHPRATNISPEKAYLYGLGKGAMVAKWWKKEKRFFALLELVEMLLVPLIKRNWSSFKGRLKGWSQYEV